MGKKVKRRELTEEERGMILGLNKAGWSLRRIATEMKCGKSTVEDLLKKE